MSDSKLLCGAWLLTCVLTGAAGADEPDSTGHPLVEAPITEDDRAHWSFRPLRRPDLPASTDQAAGAASNAIDLFVQASLAKRGLSLQPTAPMETLRRRLAFDLTGLPPDSKLPGRGDSSPRVWRRAIDQLMSSPAYGERWAQHWLDLARFAETDGFEHDKVRPTAWQYRDWVIRAWNQSLPYDAFVRQQLAGDQLAAADPIATMFCTSGPDMPDINSQKQRKHELLNEMTGAIGSVFLGLQIGCAQCHDHKYDPISQADFYRLRALFSPAVHVKRNVSIGPLEQRSAVAASRLLIRGDWRRPGPIVEPAAPRIASPPAVATPQSRAAFADWMTHPRHPLTARVIANRLWQHHFGSGLVDTPSDFGLVGDWPSHPQLLDYLACELVDSDWSLQHVQRLILNSATYRQISWPSQPEQRAAFEAAVAEDPGNRLWSRFPRKRLDGEALRDAMFACSDSLNRRMGGPGVRPPLPAELKQTLLRGQWQESEPAEHYRRSIYVFARRNLRYPIFEVLDRPDGNASCPQRAHSTTAPQALLLLNSPLTLDAAQRLAGKLFSDVAEDASLEALVEQAYRRTLARRATALEQSEAAAYIREHAELLRDGQSPNHLEAKPQPADVDTAVVAAVVEFCLALLNSNEFLYLD